jgi:hypothetical protein
VSGAPRDLLTQVIDQLRPHLARNIPVSERIRTIWSVALESRKFGATDVIADEFLCIAVETGLIADLGRHGVEDVVHTVDWAMRGLDPF